MREHDQDKSMGVDFWLGTTCLDGKIAQPFTVRSAISVRGHTCSRRRGGLQRCGRHELISITVRPADGVALERA